MAKNPKRPALTKKGPGPLLIIGGREDKSGEGEILREVLKYIGNGPLVIATVASKVNDELWSDYREAFGRHGFSKLEHLDVVSRSHERDSKAVEMLEKAAGIFFTGGDQLKLTSDLGGTPVMDAITDLHLRGGLVAGTSAGASVMSATMLVSGAADSSYRIGGGLRMAPGFGFAKDLIIDQHFAERGRIGRLLGAIAQNPNFLGVGIDENTAIRLEADRRFEVLGAGAVYVVDAGDSTDCNLSEARREESLSIFDVKMHVLSAGDSFDVVRRRPQPGTRARS